MDYSSTKFFCDLCQHGVSNVIQWIVHLTTKLHQAKLYNSPGQGENGLSEVGDRVVLASGISSTTPLKDIATHFAEFGELADFIFKGSKSNPYDGNSSLMDVIVIYKFRESVERAVHRDNLWMWGKKFEARPLFQDVNRAETPVLHNGHNGTNGSISDGGGSNYEYQVTVNGFGHGNKNGLNEPTPTTSTSRVQILENLNPYQKIALQTKDDLSDVKLEEQISAFWDLLGLSLEKIKERVQIGKDLLMILKAIFDECQILSLGLDLLGIATDIDSMNVVVDPFSKMREEKSAIYCDEESQATVCAEIFNLLKKEQYKLTFCRDVKVEWTKKAFSTTEVQKISFVHRDTNVLCNIFVENFLLVQDSKLLRFMTSLDPRLHPLLCLLRFFASVHDLFSSEDEAFKNHSIIWIFFTFLSSQKIVPTVNDLYNLKTSSLILENVDVAFCDNKNIVPINPLPAMDDPLTRTCSIIALLKEFFEFCLKSDLKHNVVCPVIGKLVPIKAFGKKIGPTFPEEIKSRYLFHSNGIPRHEKFYSGSPIGVQHPLDLITNLTENVTLAELNRFRQICAKVVTKLNKILENGSGNLIDIFDLAISKVKQQNGHATSSESEDEEESEKESPMEVEPVEESSWEMDTDQENFAPENDLKILRKGRIRVNQGDRKFFENAIAEIEGASDILLINVRINFQCLWLQYIAEFNSVFWSRCFGLVLDTESFSNSVSGPLDFSKTEESSLTLKERFDSIVSETIMTSFECQVSTDDRISDLLYKKKVWKKKFLLAHIRALWLVLTENVTSKTKEPLDLSFVKKMVPLRPSRSIQFNCKLEVTLDLRPEAEIPKNENISASVTVSLQDTSYNSSGSSVRQRKLRFLTSVYEKLCMKYCNLRIKQWLESCKDFDQKAFGISFKKERKKEKGHPKYRKFRLKRKRMLAEIEKQQKN